jgi:hypothetical protein
LIGTPGYAVPDPAPRLTRTDPGPEGHVRRESREVGGGEGGGRSASLGPSAGACALSEPDSLMGDGASLSSRVTSPGLDASYSSGGIWMGMRRNHSSSVGRSRAGMVKVIRGSRRLNITWDDDCDDHNELSYYAGNRGEYCCPYRPLSSVKC